MKVSEVKVDQRWTGAKARLYVWPKGETLFENLQNRRQRPYNVYKKEVLPEVWKQLGVDPLRVRWSRYAGCSCPCSPGFIVEGGLFGKDVHVTVE